MNIYEQQTKNKRLTAIIMVVFVAFFIFLGLGFDYFYGSFRPQQEVEFVDYGGHYEGDVSNQPVPYFTIIAFFVACFMVGNSALNGSKMVLRSTMARRAKSSNPKEQQFLNIVYEMSIASGLPKPHAYIIPDHDLNAFATGFNPEKSYIAVTEGLIAKLNREELQAVVAHEMSHIRNYDIRLMTIVSALMGAIVLLRDFTARRMFWGGRGRSRSSSSSSGGGPIMIALFVIWIIAMIFAPFFTRLLAMAISRKREYLADASAAELTRNPKGLISALEKIKAAVMPTKAINNGVAHMCITDPRGSLIEEKMGLTADLLATHPPMAKRILALKMMSYQ